MSAVQKGNGYEIEVVKILQAEGWKVFRQHRKPMFLRRFDKRQATYVSHMITVGADVFGCDIIAKKAGQRPLWIQVSTREQKAAKIRQVMEHPWNFEHERAQVWLRTSGKREFEIFEGPAFDSIGTCQVPKEKPIRETAAA